MSIYLSASSIKDFIACPQKVLYRRTKPFPEVRSREMIMGEIAHSAIEQGWKSRERAYQVINYQYKKMGLNDKDRVSLEFYIDMFFLNFRDRLSDNDHIEYNFKFALHDDVFMVGKIDRISDGNLYDWKTGSRVPTKLGNDVQCIIYDFAYKKIFGKEANSICLAALATGELVPYVKSEMHTEQLFNKIIPRMIKTIKNESYEKLGMFNHSCFRCPYKQGCLGGTENYVMDSGVTPE